MTPEIRKDVQGLETQENGEKASAPTPRERVAGIYPDADPRKFNTRTSEQEVAEYVAHDHTQPIDSLHSVDAEHIHGARMQEEKAEKEYPAPHWGSFVVATLIAFLSLFVMPSGFFASFPAYVAPLVMLAFVFASSLLILPDYRALNKEYKVLGFNPLKALFIFDMIMLLIGMLNLIMGIIESLL